MVAKGIGVVSIETLTRQGIKVQSESPQAKGLQKLIMKLGYDKAIYKYQDWEKHNNEKNRSIISNIWIMFRLSGISTISQS